MARQTIWKSVSKFRSFVLVNVSLVFADIGLENVKQQKNVERNDNDAEKFQITVISICFLGENKRERQYCWIQWGGESVALVRVLKWWWGDVGASEGGLVVGSESWVMWEDIGVGGKEDGD